MVPILPTAQAGVTKSRIRVRDDSRDGTKIMKYDYKKIERKWQRIWRKEKIYEPSFANASASRPDLKAKGKKKKFYNLMMFPYPSAEGLHVGNVYAFTGSDIYGRFKRMNGYDVFEPIGLDGFGIHSENYAIKTGAHPKEQAKTSEKRFYKQLEVIGNSFSWEERLETYKPEYYRWTQWIFAQMFKQGLAYRKKAAVNWCPSCKTVLADEQAEKGSCERCGSEVVQKELEQWFFKITQYADRLLKNLEKIDWTEKVKIAQRNWIGRSEGALLKFKVESLKCKVQEIEVFTTRPDTLFGATFVVISPELAKQWIGLGWGADKKVKEYIEEALARRSKTEEEQEKTGVFSGIEAINPASEEKIPVWVSDYVLAGYGTGAIMAVPAHDARDFAFARKFKLPIKRVIVRREMPARSYLMGADQISDENLRSVGISIVGKTSEGNRKIEIPGKYLPAYENLIQEKLTPGFWNEYVGEEIVFIFKHTGGEIERIALNSRTAEEINRLACDFAKEQFVSPWLMLAENDWYTDVIFHEENGTLENSEEFDGIDSVEAKHAIARKVGGKWQTHFRLRDWLISRQRYWGPPIPLVYCEACAQKVSKAGSKEKKKYNPGELENPGWFAVDEKELPVKLPFIEDFRPTGQGPSPLAHDEKFVKTKCPKCGGEARRETDVSDTFLDSAWYHLGYLMVSREWKLDIEDKKFQTLSRNWLPVDMYIGGAEHSVLHLLYVRFLALAFHDWGLTHFEEPFPMFRAHGLIIKDGTKMSKSKGNVVNPDEYVKRFGADALRMYLMFLAPFEQGGDFRDSGILGVVRFLERVWKFATERAQGKTKEQDSRETTQALHRGIKKVTEDLEKLHYNTAVSALMILLNELEKEKNISISTLETFLKLLAPFAPHLTEELWSRFFEGKNREFRSIHLEAWPKYDTKLARSDEVTIAIQINGKTRSTVTVARGAAQEEVMRAALAEKRIAAHVKGKKTKKTIFVPDRIINIIV